MEQVICLLMVLKIINLKQKTLKLMQSQYVSETFSKDFSIYHMKKTGFYVYVYDFSVDYDAIEADDILDIHKYLMKKNNIKQCLDLF